MLGTGPIRVGRHEWVLMRNDPRVPAAIVRRLHPGTSLEHYRVVTFDVDPARRLLVGRFTSLEAADRSVLYALPTGHTPPHSGYPSYA
ncbi:MAG: hypothetical protein Q7T71_00965 [Herbiconiux sp.]|nr:hypothetical protein [Herbiconiux sp.]